MPNLSSDQVLNKYINALGEREGSILFHFEQDFWNSITEWDIFETLFRSEHRISLMENHSTNFWLIVQNCLIDQSILNVCRLTENKKTRNNINLSIEQVCHSLNVENDKTINNSVLYIKDQTPAIRKWRDKLISHSDVPTKINKEISLSLEYQKITNSYTGIFDILNRIHALKFDSEWARYPLGNKLANDALELLYLFSIPQAQEILNSEIPNAPNWLFSSRDEEKRYFRK